MSDYQSINPNQYPDVLGYCMSEAYRLNGMKDEDPAIEDVMLWSQLWPSIACGFASDEPVIHIPTWSPTVVVKFDKYNRYVFHDRKFAYQLKGETTIQYYDAVRAKKLPGADDPQRVYLVNGAQ